MVTRMPGCLCFGLRLALGFCTGLKLGLSQFATLVYYTVLGVWGGGFISLLSLFSCKGVFYVLSQLCDLETIIFYACVKFLHINMIYVNLCERQVNCEIHIN